MGYLLFSIKGLFLSNNMVQAKKVENVGKGEKPRNCKSTSEEQEQSRKMEM